MGPYGTLRMFLPDPALSSPWPQVLLPWVPWLFSSMLLCSLCISYNYWSPQYRQSAITLPCLGGAGGVGKQGRRAFSILWVP